MPNSIRSRSTRVNPATLLMQPWTWGQIEVDGLTTAVVGTGSVNVAEPRVIDITTGATTGGTALARTADNSHWSRGVVGIINFDKRVVLKVTIRTVSATTNGKFRFTFGKAPATGVGALAVKGIGFQIDNLAINGLSHDGTDLTTTDLSTNLAADQTLAEFIIESHAGTVRFYVDNVLKGTSTGGPTGNRDSDPVIQLEVDNGADNAAQRHIINQIQYAIEQ